MAVQVVKEARPVAAQSIESLPGGACVKLDDLAARGMRNCDWPADCTGHISVIVGAAIACRRGTREWRMYCSMTDAEEKFKLARSYLDVRR
jgi:hypothetical protein